MAEGFGKLSLLFAAIGLKPHVSSMSFNVERSERVGGTTYEK